MNYSLEYLIDLSKRTGDRLIVHDSVMGEAFVIMPLESYENFLQEKKYSFENDEFEPESDADVLNRINSEIDAWRERQTEEAVAEWVSAEDEENEEAEKTEAEDEIDADEEPMYHEIVEEDHILRNDSVIPELPPRDLRPEMSVENTEDEPGMVNVMGSEVSSGLGEETIKPSFGLDDSSSLEDAPWEKFKKMGAPLDPEELNSIPETTDFAGMDFGGELLEDGSVFLDEPVE